MRLSDAHTATLEESRLAFTSVAICEDDEGPRWRFRYDSTTASDSPDILLLGAYKHPSTGNYLIGGINLNYLDKKQRDNLAKNLPKIMRGNNLYSRYWIGRKTNPDIFDNFYRTYNAEYVKGVSTDVMYPKYGVYKTGKDWLKKKLSGLFKTKAQRQRAQEPKYPEDLDNMQDRLDQVVRRIQQPAEPTEPEEPKPTERQPRPEEPRETQPEPDEMQTARDAYRQQQLEKQREQADAERREDLPVAQGRQELDQELGEPQIDPEEARRELQQQRVETQRELRNPENEINLYAPGTERQEQPAPERPEEPERPITPEPDLEEPEEEPETGEAASESTIAYYSPVAGRVIFEPLQKALLHDACPLFNEGWGDKKTLEGEYWLNEGEAIWAADDNFDHTTQVVVFAQYAIADELGFDVDDEFVDWERFVQFLREQYPAVATDTKLRDPKPRPHLQALLQQYGLTLELWDIANWSGDTDPRLYAAKQWGWVRNEGNNLETYDLSSSKMSVIAEGLTEAYPEEDLIQQCFDIYVFQSDDYYRSVPFDVLDAGEMKSLRDYA